MVKKAILSPGATQPFSPLSPVFGILGHSAIWDIWYLSDVRGWAQLAVLKKMTEVSMLYCLSLVHSGGKDCRHAGWQSTFSAAPGLVS